MNSTWCRALLPAAVLFAARCPRMRSSSRRSQQSVLLAAGGPASVASTAAAAIRPAPISSASSRRPRQASRPSSTARRPRRAAPAAKAPASSSLFSGQPRAMRPAQQPDPADARQPRAHSDPTCERLQRRCRARARRSAPRHPGGAGAEQLRPAVSQQAAATQPAARRPSSTRCSGRGRSSRRATVRDPDCRCRAAPSAPSACAPATATIFRFRPRPTPAASPTTRRPASASCPAAEATLFTHRNPGEDMNAGGVDRRRSPTRRCRMRSATARRSTRACSCRRPGESWAQALKNIERRRTVEQGDIVVTEQRATPVVAAARRRAGQADPAAPSTARPRPRPRRPRLRRARARRPKRDAAG